MVNKTITVNHVVTDIYIDGHCQRVIKDKTKSKSSTRKLPLVPPFEAVLKYVYQKQHYQQYVCGDSYCKEYLDYINKTETGELIKPGYVTDHFQLLLKKNGLRRIRFHDLRHPYVKHTTKKYNSEKQKTQATKIVDLIAWGFCFCFVCYSKRSWTL